MTKFIKYAVIAILFIIVIMLAMFMYRMYMQFKRSIVKSLCMDRAAMFGENSKTAYTVLINGCEAILKNADLSAQVIAMAKADGITNEEELVNTAMANAMASGFLTAPVVEQTNE